MRSVAVFDKFGALNSRPVWQALIKGCANLGLTCRSHDMSADLAIIWSVVWAGRMRSNRQVWQHFRQQGRPVIVAEVGTLDRGRTWKLGLNGTGLSSTVPGMIDPDRPARLNIHVKPWRKTGDHVLIALQRQDSEQWQSAPVDWLQSVVDGVGQHTDREIVIRPHPRYRGPLPKSCKVQPPLPCAGTYDSFDILSAISQAWAVINWNSGIGPQSVINGVPVIVGLDSLAAPVGSLDVANVESPSMQDRDQWLQMLCHTEWTIDEIATGHPLKRLIDHL